MNDRDTMQLALCVMLLVSGLLRLLRRTLCRSQMQPALPAGALLAGYGLLSAGMCGVLYRSYGLPMLLAALLLIICTGSAAAGLQGLWRAYTRRRLLPAALLLIWLCAVAVFTVLMRKPVEAGVLLRFDAAADVVRLHSLSPLTDVALNLAMFLPLGLLLPMADAQPRPFMNVLSTALVLSAAAEGVQLLFSLGQADVEDLSANILGALAGYGLQRLFVRKA